MSNNPRTWFHYVDFEYFIDITKERDDVIDTSKFDKSKFSERFDAFEECLKAAQKHCNNHNCNMHIIQFRYLDTGHGYFLDHDDIFTVKPNETDATDFKIIWSRHKNIDNVKKTDELLSDAWETCIEKKMWYSHFEKLPVKKWKDRYESYDNMSDMLKNLQYVTELIEHSIHLKKIWDTAPDYSLFVYSYSYSNYMPATPLHDYKRFWDFTYLKKGYIADEYYNRHIVKIFEDTEAYTFSVSRDRYPNLIREGVIDFTEFDKDLDKTVSEIKMLSDKLNIAGLLEMKQH